MGNSYDESHPAHWSSYDRVATASADALQRILRGTTFSEELEASLKRGARRAR